MSSAIVKDADVLIPAPHLFRVGIEEFRMAPLPVRRLLEAVRYIEKNYDILEKAKALGQPEDQGGMKPSQFLEDEVYVRLNGLLRLLFTEKREQDLLSDKEWCANHLSNAHYRAFLMVAMRQNQLDGLFQTAKGYLGAHVEAALRQSRTEPTGQIQ